MIALCKVWAILSEAMGNQWGDCEIHYQTLVDSSYDLKFSFEKIVAEHKTVSALMIRLSFASFEGAFLCWRPVIKILWLPKSHWQLKNIWAPGDEHMELPCVEEIAMNVHRFLHFFFLANHWLKIVQPSNSVTLLVPGRSTVIKTKLNGMVFLTLSILLASKQQMGTCKWHWDTPRRCSVGYGFAFQHFVFSEQR